jgi:alcohol dehydrogenase
VPGFYLMPRVNLLEKGCLKHAGQWMINLGGSKALIVASLGDYGQIQGDKVLSVIQQAGLDGIVFAGAGPNPTDTMVSEAVLQFFRHGCDSIIAIGGGSAIDCAKACCLTVSKGAEGPGTGQSKRPPLIAVNTTAGTGSEVTSFAVITDSSSHDKITLNDWSLMPDVSINDPELMLTMPSFLTASTGMDALSHAVEAYVSSAASEFSDGLALRSIRIIFRWLPMAVRYGANIEAREAMCYGSFMAGVAFNNSGLGYVHALSHPVSGKYGSPHGVVNSVLLPVVERFNIKAEVSKLADIGHAIALATYGRYGLSEGEHKNSELAEMSVRAFRGLALEVGMPASLRELGVREEDIPELAKKASLETVGETNPRQAVLEEFEALYREAL